LPLLAAGLSIDDDDLRDQQLAAANNNLDRFHRRLELDGKSY